MKTNPNLTIAIPSNGALYEPTLVFLSECGLKVNRENNRRYIATIPFLPGVDVLFQRSSDITGKVEDGNADLGIVGYDRYLELKTNNKPTMVLMNQLGFGACSLAIGIPDSWVDVTSIADLAEVAAEFRSNGMTIRVATKFPRLTEQFFMANSISNFSIVPSSGTLEIAPEMGFADIISDITSSGTTMKENRLKTLSGGTIIKSECCLISNNISISTDSFKSEAAEQIIAMIKANIQSKNFYQVKANIKSGSLSELTTLISTSLKFDHISLPTISEIHAVNDTNLFEITSLIDKKNLMESVNEISSLGAYNITVEQPKYLFKLPDSDIQVN